MEDIRRRKAELSMPLRHKPRLHIVLFKRSNMLLFAISLAHSLTVIYPTSGTQPCFMANKCEWSVVQHLARRIWPFLSTATLQN